jgi:XTP/dITP diphosphohydrolase
MIKYIPTFRQDANMNTLLLATNNPGKVAEIKALLEGRNLTILTPVEAGLDLVVVEDGLTYAENATKKALAYARAGRLIAMGDDSGLEVEGLNGQPGVHSHRFVPLPEATDADRRKYLLDRLKDKPRPWAAHFHAAIAIALPAGRVRLAAGRCDGEIIPEERGNNGFGYDPIFYIPELGRTMAELDMNEKNRLSHRARAVQNAIPILEELFKQSSG